MKVIIYFVAQEFYLIGLNRGEELNKKIVKGLCKIKYAKGEPLEVGNIYSMRDWGFARDYVEISGKCSNKKPDDYVISTGETHTIKEFINNACKIIGFKPKWKGKGLNEKCYDLNSNKVIVKINKKYFRPVEVDFLKGDNNKARRILNWKPKTSFIQLVKLMRR